MRLYKFISESKRFEELDLTPEEVAITIKRDCKKYLKETKGNWFQRAMDIRLDPKIPAGYRITRQDRRSLGMEEDIAKKFNSWLVKNGHADRSKSIMCSRKARSLFGLPYYVFIEGNYKYTWVDAEDINEDTEATGWYGSMVDEFVNMDTYDRFWGPPNLRKERDKKRRELQNLGVSFSHEEWNEIDREHNEKVKKWLKEVFASYFHTNKQMHMAYANNAEIWFQCKGYYFTRVDDRKTYQAIKGVVK